MVDFLLYEGEDNSAKLLVLLVTRTAAIAGDVIIVYNRKSGENVFMKENYVLELLNVFKSLHYGPNNDRDIIGAPYLSRQLHRLEIQVSFATVPSSVWHQ